LKRMVCNISKNVTVDLKIWKTWTKYIFKNFLKDILMRY
jgi:hypothetical protein